MIGYRSNLASRTASLLQMFFFKVIQIQVGIVLVPIHRVRAGVAASGLKCICRIHIDTIRYHT